MTPAMTLRRGATPAGRVFVVMGVSGCGKSTIAERLAALVDGDFLDGDTLHPQANIAKMGRGEPLSDDDRAPWLDAVRHVATRRAAAHGIHVVACSALAERYRDVLRSAGDTRFVFLDGSRTLIAARMHERCGHFMPDSLLDSQFDALERPDGETDVVRIDIDDSPDVIARNACDALVALYTVGAP